MASQCVTCFVHAQSSAEFVGVLSLSLVLGTSSFSSQLEATKGGKAPPSFYEYLDESDEEKVRQTCQSVPLRTMLLGSGTNPTGPTPRFGTWIRLVSEPGFVSFRNLDSSCFGTRLKWSPKARKWFLGSGFWAGFWEVVSGKWFLGAGFCEVVSGGGFWEVVAGKWCGFWEVVSGKWCGFWEVVSGSGFWEVVCGKWFLGSGFWRLVSGDWFLGSGFWGLVSEKRSFLRGWW